ncbi:MAG TPA: hypothetical protein VM428_10265 [Microlunatus sp.]|nr:hypothetical protein [Microlunatus sp.]
MTTPALPFVRDPRWVFDFLLAAVVTVVCAPSAGWRSPWCRPWPPPDGRWS